MLSENLIGEWKSNSHSIFLYNPAPNQLSACIHDRKGSKTEINSDHIKCGILGVTSPDELIQKINQLAQEKFKAIAVCCYPSPDQPTEVWVFEAMKGAVPWIKKAREILKTVNSENQEKVVECYQNALKNLVRALDQQQSQEGDIKELKLTIEKVKKRTFFATSQTRSSPLSY